MTNDFNFLSNLIEEVHSKTREYKVSLDFLMTPDFIKSHSYFKTLQCLKRASGLIDIYVTEKEIYASTEWDGFIRKNTVFDTWRDMRLKASIIYIKYKLPHLQ
ncbi:hypothetical protein PESP_a0510 [Pseudoalteromonas espejiana DSM 9414]|uniref:Uncharacterized protein n=1 Tax=Pseudoalteromonas espejiana TaxID=28107 RepID=A0A510XXY6_9GAMM|nr:hypothetical protein [Pseudoalteromonas espejiana]ASM48750.1 hypothetical protein PESP_a0510 [Pseudoalteromonas espejiana DSM 9414]GEK55910.1 hypothetical protein PES01_27550 [Pseudoalteromonas espejiana]